MKLSTALLSGGTAVALAFTFAPCAQADILLNSLDAPTKGYGNIDFRSYRAQQFTISDHNWTIDRIDIGFDRPFIIDPSTTLRAYIYSGYLWPETRVATLTTLYDTGRFVPTEPLVLGPGEYWFALERSSGDVEYLLWTYGDPVSGPGDNPDYADFFSFGARGDSAMDAAWSTRTDSAYRMAVRGSFHSAIPEPGTVALVAAGAVGLALLRRKRS